MPRNSMRIVILRSGRHLGVALDALSAAYPGCEISIVATPGWEQDRATGRIPPTRRIICETLQRFAPAAFVRSGAVRRILERRFDKVAVLWPDAKGTGQGNVDRTALVVSPRGFDAITPGGVIIRRRTVALIGRETFRGVCSLTVWVVLAGALYGPALLAGAMRRTLPTASSPATTRL